MTAIMRIFRLARRNPRMCPSCGDVLQSNTHRKYIPFADENINKWECGDCHWKSDGKRDDIKDGARWFAVGVGVLVALVGIWVWLP